MFIIQIFNIITKVIVIYYTFIIRLLYIPHLLLVRA